MRRRAVSPAPISSEAAPIRPTRGSGLAVFGSFRAAADGAPAAPAAVEDDGTAEPLVAAAEPPAAARANEALTCFSVITFGGIEVTMVADSVSPALKSEISAGLPSLMILTPRLFTSLCVNILKPSGV